MDLFRCRVGVRGPGPRGRIALVLACGLVSGLFSPLSGQDPAAVSGRVTSSSGSALPFVQVSVPGSAVGTLTDSEGRFEISRLPAGAVTLRFELIGYATVDVEAVPGAGETAIVEVVMTRTAISLDEILVTITGSERRAEVANAVSTLNAPDVVEAAPVTNLSTLLAGRAAGVQVSTASGTTGMGSRVRIRGAGSISLSVTPLIYVDGVRVGSVGGYTIFTGGQAPGRLDDINPEDIESIDIVRGPAAATLYGTEAANGVIRITTKRGRAGQTRWSVWAEGGVLEDRTVYPLNYAGLSDSPPFTRRCFLLAEQAGLCTQTGLSSFQVLNDPVHSPRADGSRRTFGASVSGGSGRVDYYVSAEMEDEVGPLELPSTYRPDLVELGIPVDGDIERPSGLERISLRTNLNAQLSEDADIGVRVGYVSSDLRVVSGDNSTNGPITSALLGGAFEDEPATWWAFSTPTQMFGLQAAQAVERLTASAQGRWSPLVWLRTRATLGVDSYAQDDSRLSPRGLFPSSLGQKIRNLTNVRQYTLDASATASSDLSDSFAGGVTSETTLGVQYYRNVLARAVAIGEDIPLGGGSVGLAAQTFADELNEEEKTAGVFVQQRFGVADRLFVTAALRADDNSAFGRDFDLVYYPKLGVSYVITDEPFMDGFDVLDELRLRAAWGQSGLQPTATAALQTLEANTVVTPDDEIVSGVSIGSLGNSLLEPERSTEIEVGFDAEFASGRVGVEVTHYDTRTTDALVLVPVAGSAGATRVRWDNVGEVRNRGFEGRIFATVLERGWLGWDVNVTGSVNDNEVVDLGNLDPIGGRQRVIPGRPLWGYWDYPVLDFEDSDGDGQVAPGELTIGDTTAYIGPSVPSREASLSSTVHFGSSLSLRVQFDYRGGFYKENLTELFRCQLRICRAANDRDAPLDDRIRAAALLSDPRRPATGFIEKGDFVRFREVAVTYSAPASLADRIGAARASLTLSGRNLATFTDYSGLDPEVLATGITGGFVTREFFTQPLVRAWSLRLSLAF